MTGDRAEERAVDRVAELLGRQIGLRPQSNLRGRLRRCIQDEAAACGRDVDHFVEEIAVRRGAFQSLVNRVTVQESSFFRHPEHFEMLARDVLPALPRPVRIWSAGCGNGQEAFSLAMILAELHIEGTVYATDLSTDALARTVEATYTAREVAGLSPARMEKHLTAHGAGWRVNAALRARVVTAQHNLIDALPEPALSCQVIFCRNVLIYFEPYRTRTFLDLIADRIPAAVVFLGAAETMWSSSDRFRTVQSGGSYYYRPRTAAGSRQSPPPVADRAPSAVPALAAPLTVAPLTVAPLTVAPLTGGTLTGGTLTGGTAGRDHRRPDRIPPRPSSPVARSTASTEVSTAGSRPDEGAVLAVAGQLALDAGDHRSAVVAFRKCTYLTPDDALAHLHLGLALEAFGDQRSARRAFATARRTMLASASPPSEHAIGGYATDELLRLLDDKQEELAP